MNNRKQIMVDLTPLLDVILIILFMFVVRSSTGGGNVASEQKKLSDVKQEVSKVEREINSLKAIDKACRVINITIDSDEKSSKRKLIVKKEDEDETITEFEKEDLTFVKNTLKSKLSEKFLKTDDDEQLTLLVFQYNSDKIYISEYNLVDDILKKIQKGNEKIYISYMDSSE